ncbi:hypothetical protein UREG_01665 [Uncinocarpus reesii 1704]|uniref:Secretory phospholipase A2 n=1 Tax=Uncinocarpus reesii (strain UAMH 1704) TaxID=336963 RepID=C4JJ58_UNCRE|nr:uncharacterized protein UREG_01665 [Uncinocarpus reesii 1704]EEP76816.1 hypothetical protein UREG_01665 [Uncinocarpus reesii 1704]
MKLNTLPLFFLGFFSPPALSAPVESGTTAASLSTRADACTVALTDQYMFKDPITTFQSHRNAKQPSCFDWSSDNCTSSPDKPVGFNFIPSCQRHDFGYRNTKKQGRFNETIRKRIDDMFKSDLYKECSQYSGWESWKGVKCREIANVYYEAVRRRPAQPMIGLGWPLTHPSFCQGRASSSGSQTSLFRSRDDGRAANLRSLEKQALIDHLSRPNIPSNHLEVGPGAQESQTKRVFAPTQSLRTAMFDTRSHWCESFEARSAQLHGLDC